MSDDSNPFNPLDPLDLGFPPEDTPPVQDSPAEEPEIPETVEALDTENFAPDIPQGDDSPTAIVPAEHSESELGHISLAESQVIPKNRLVIPEIDVQKNVTAQQKKLLDKAMRDYILYGASTAAMVCRGQGDEYGKSCPYAEKCPLLRVGIPVPIGEDCPVEMTAIQTWNQAYLRELDVNPHDVMAAFDTQAANLMAGLHLQVNRARWGEALNPLLEQEMEMMSPGNVINTIKTGNYNTDYRDKATKLLSKLGRDNMQTRERKVSLMRSGFKDISKHNAEVQQRLEALEKKRLTSVEEEAEFTEEGVMTRLSRVQRFNEGAKDEDGNVIEQAGALDPDRAE